MRLRLFFLAALLVAQFRPTAVYSKGKLPPEQEYKEEYKPGKDHHNDFEDGGHIPPKLKDNETVQETEPVESEPVKSKRRKPEPEPETLPEVQEETSQTPKAPETAVPEMNAQVPEGSLTHQVWIWQESRDCLWTLAKQYYKDPWQWKKIYIENRNTILNPNIIFPKQKIIIPPLQTAAK